MEPVPANLSDAELESRRASVRRGLQRLQTAAALVLVLVIVLATAALLQAWRAERKSGEATRASRQAELELWHSRLLQAQSGRGSGRVGRRQESWAAIQAAAAWQSSLELRNEAVGVMALTDLEGPPVRQELPANSVLLAVDGECRWFAAQSGEGDIIVGPVGSDAGRFRLATGLPARGTAFFSPDGRQLAVRSPAGEMQLWDLAARSRRALKAPKRAETFWGNTISFTPDSKILAFRVGANRIRFCAVTNGWEYHAPLVLRAEPCELCFDPTGRILAVTLYSARKIQLWDWQAGLQVGELDLPAEPCSLGWHPDGIRLAVGCVNANVYVVEPRSGLRRELSGHTANVAFVGFHPGGELLISASWDGTARFWDAGSGATLFTMTEGVPLGFGAAGQKVIVGEEGGARLAVWRVQLGTGYRTLRGGLAGAKDIWSTSFSGDGHWLAAGTERGLELWDLARGTQVAEARVGSTYSVEFAPGTGELLTAGQGGVQVWPVGIAGGNLSGTNQLGQPRRITLEDGSLPVRAHWQEGGRSWLLLTRATVRWQERNGAAARWRVVGNGYFNDGCLDPGGKWLATSTWLGEGTQIWDAKTGRFERQIDRDAFVTFTPEGQGLLVGTGTDNTCYNTANWSVRWRRARIAAGINTGPVGVSPRGDFAAIAGTSSQVELVLPGTGQPLTILPAPVPQQIRSLGINEAGTQLAVATANRDIQLWNLGEVRGELARLGLDWGDGGHPATLLTRPDRTTPSPALFVLAFLSCALALVLLAAIFQRHRQLINRYGEIEATAAERGRALVAAQTEVFLSHKMRALGTLAAGIAHDFNNLLSVIRMANKSIARQVQRTPEIEADLADIEETVLQGKNIVRSMLGYSREAGDETAVCAVAEVVQDTINLLSKPFLAGIDLQLELDGTLPPAPVSRARLGQILLNLIVNAAEAMAGHGQLRVVVQRQTGAEGSPGVLRPRASSRYLELEVADTGPGIAPANLERIFEPFFTTKQTGATRGTGLGLSVVYAMAQQEGIGIALHSEVGRGTRFRLIIPLV